MFELQTNQTTNTFKKLVRITTAYSVFDARILELEVSEGNTKEFIMKRKSDLSTQELRELLDGEH